MRTPKRCPFCGSRAAKARKYNKNYKATKAKADQVFYVRTFGCGAMWHYRLADGAKRWEGGCGRYNAKGSAAYRETLAWRKRLSQILAIALPKCREPDDAGVSTARWVCGRKSIVIYRGQRGWVLACPMFGDFSERRAEARRRLLAMGEA